MTDKFAQPDYRPTENGHKVTSLGRFILPCCAVGFLALVGFQMAMNAQ